MNLQLTQPFDNDVVDEIKVHIFNVVKIKLYNTFRISWQLGISSIGFIKIIVQNCPIGPLKHF